MRQNLVTDVSERAYTEGSNNGKVERRFDNLSQELQVKGLKQRCAFQEWKSGTTVAFKT